MDSRKNEFHKLLFTIQTLTIVTLLLILACLVLPIFFLQINPSTQIENTTSSKIPTLPTSNYWMAPSINTIQDNKLKAKVNYGKDLISHTSRYFGPNGTIAQTSNGLNCQNCHLNAGTVIFGNNYGSVASLYPKFRARSGTIETVYKRVNDCFERSLNGVALDTLSIEMQAMVAYIHFIGSNVKKGKKAEGSGLKELSYLDRAADTVAGKLIYQAKCKICHQSNGQGLLNSSENEFVNPALWGQHSYNDGAGLFRISNLAKYVKYNMPQGVTFQSPTLTDEEAWDVAAYINSQPRPHKNTPNDWPDIKLKPIDYPFSPYVDLFSEIQHKYGPFNEMLTAQKKESKK
jgi:thiosulfate dehydrogenase